MRLAVSVRAPSLSLKGRSHTHAERVAARETVTRRISVVAFTQYAALLCAAALRW